MGSNLSYMRLELDKKQAKLWSKLTRMQKSFIRELLSGQSKSKALKAAGSRAASPSALTAGSGEMLKNSKVVAFMRSIQPNLHEAINDEVVPAIMDARERMNRLSNIGRGRVTDVLTLEDNTLTINDLSRLSADVIDTIKELRVTPDGCHISFHDPVKAIMLLNEMDKLLADDPQAAEIPTLNDVIRDLESRTPNTKH